MADAVIVEDMISPEQVFKAELFALLEVAGRHFVFQILGESWQSSLPGIIGDSSGFQAPTL